MSVSPLQGLLLAIAVTLPAVCVGQSSPTDIATQTHNKVESRGLGKTITVKEANGKVIRGTIVAIEPDSFQVKPEHGSPTVHIRNDEVVKAENGGLRTSIKVTLYVVLGVILLGAIVGTRV